MKKQQIQNLSFAELRRKNKATLIDHAFRVYGLVGDYEHDKQYFLNYLLAGGDFKTLIERIKSGISKLDMAPSASFEHACFGVVTPINNDLEFISGDLYYLPVLIKNDSKSTWMTDKTTPIYLSYHWYSENGDSIIFDGERTELIQPVNPGEMLEQMMRIASPCGSGNYQIELTLIMESQFWFEDRGLSVLRHPALVKPPVLLLKEKNWEDFIASKWCKRNVDEIRTAIGLELESGFPPFENLEFSIEAGK